MASLGRLMPHALVRARIEQQLVPGAVVKLNVQFEDGTSKEKLLVVLSVSHDTLCCVINSEINPFVQNRPALLRAQVPVLEATHSFLRHDSHADCSKIRRFSTSKVLDDLVGEPDWMLGKITGDVRDDIAAALTISSTIPQNESAPLIESLRRATL